MLGVHLAVGLRHSVPRHPSIHPATLRAAGDWLRQNADAPPRDHADAQGPEELGGQLAHELCRFARALPSDAFDAREVVLAAALALGPRADKE